MPSRFTQNLITLLLKAVAIFYMQFRKLFIFITDTMHFVVQ